MLNAKALCELLTKNRDERLCKRWFLMTPNGTLLAYSEPADIKSLRRETTMVAISWQEHDQQHGEEPTEPETDAAEGQSTKSLRTLTIETETANWILRRLQPQLVLVLEGGVPRRRSKLEARVTPERLDDRPHLGQTAVQGGSGAGSSASSVAESTNSSVAPHSVLGLQRKKLDAMASAVSRHFERTGFQMPDEDGIRLF